MKKIVCFFLSFFLASSLISCSVSETAPPHQLFEEIEKSYGALPPGLFFDSRAKEWEENYLDSDVIEHVFGDEKEYKEAVASAYFYLSSSLSVYEEIFILECYTSDQARRMAGAFSERDRTLSSFEEEPPEAEILCSGRTVAYCRLCDTVRAKNAIRQIEK